MGAAFVIFFSIREITAIRRELRIAGGASTHGSVCASRRQWCLAPLPWDQDVSASSESALRLQGVRGLSTVPLRTTISNCAHGQTQRVGGLTVPYGDSLLGRSWLLPALAFSHLAGMMLSTRCDPSASVARYYEEAIGGPTCSNAVRSFTARYFGKGSAVEMRLYPRILKQTGPLRSV
jgi:hypothetical protein